MSRIWFWITRSFYVLFVIFLLLSLWVSQEWVKGSVEFKKSGAINLVKILARDYHVHPSQVSGYTGQKKGSQKFLFFTSGNSYPDFGTINYFYGSSGKKIRKELKEETGGGNHQAKKIVLAHANSGIVWRTYENTPNCCKVKGGANHIIDQDSAQVVLAEINSKNPPKSLSKNLLADFQILSGLASTNQSGFQVVSKVKGSPKIETLKSYLSFLAGPGRYAHVPFIAFSPKKYVEIFARTGTWVVTIAVLILSFFFLRQKTDKNGTKPVLQDLGKTPVSLHNPVEGNV